MSKRPVDHVVHDLLNGPAGDVSRVCAVEVRRRDFCSVPIDVVDELCAWCGVDRAGGCGACSDLKVEP